VPGAIVGTGVTRVSNTVPNGGCPSGRKTETVFKKTGNSHVNCHSESAVKMNKAGEGTVGLGCFLGEILGVPSVPTCFPSCLQHRQHYYFSCNFLLPAISPGLLCLVF
jgi:hypothetical protein